MSENVTHPEYAACFLWVCDTINPSIEYSIKYSGLDNRRKQNKHISWEIIQRMGARGTGTETWIIFGRAQVPSHVNYITKSCWPPCNTQPKVVPQWLLASVR